jgi:hypothetical protein
MIYEFTKEQILYAIENTATLKEVASYLGIKTTGRGVYTVL